MGTPSNDDTFEAKVQAIVKQATVDESGNLKLPDGVEADESVLYAAKLEKRHRDTQSAYTKNQQELKRIKAENDKLASNWEADAVKNLSNTEQARLEELKVQDPDAWRDEITKLENNKRTEFNEKRQNITKEVSEMTELEARQVQLEEFNAANPDFVLNDDVIENDIPPRITRKLEKGEITFSDFLEECKEYIEKPKKIADNKADDEPGTKFTKSGGSNKPSDEAINKQSSSDYNKEVF